MARIEAAVVAVERGLAEVSEVALAAEYPERIAGYTVTTGEWLVHLAAHLGYHLGQVDYHRRLVTGRGETVAAMAIPELRSARAGRRREGDPRGKGIGRKKSVPPHGAAVVLCGG